MVVDGAITSVRKDIAKATRRKHCIVTVLRPFRDTRQFRCQPGNRRRQHSGAREILNDKDLLSFKIGRALISTGSPRRADQADLARPDTAGRLSGSRHRPHRRFDGIFHGAARR